MNERVFKILEDLPFVYHYTSMEALFSILEGYRPIVYTGIIPFRASCIYNANDPREMELGFDVVKRNLPQFEKKNQYNMNLSEVYQDSSYKQYYLDNYYRKPINGMIQYSLVPYTISFSHKRDFLPMWSMYGNNCKGVCLKFNINRIMERPIEKSHFDFVSYDGDKEYDIMDDHFALLYDLEAKKSNKPKRIEEKKEILSTCCLCVSPFIKCSDWSYENEFRIVYNHNYEPEVDNNYRLGVPFGIKMKKVQRYVDYPINSIALEEIIIGPLANYQVVEHIIRNELKECLLNSVTITPSLIEIT